MDDKQRRVVEIHQLRSDLFVAEAAVDTRDKRINALKIEAIRLKAELEAVTKERDKLLGKLLRAQASQMTVDQAVSVRLRRIGPTGPVTQLQADARLAAKYYRVKLWAARWKQLAKSLRKDESNDRISQ